MSKFFQFVMDSKTPIEVLDGRTHHWHFNPEVTEGADTILVKVIMKQGACHDFHRHPEMNEILYFLKGKAEQWVENEKQILGPGDSVYLDPNMVHATFNIGDEDLEFLAVLAPGNGWKAGTIDEFLNEPYASYRK